jgi:outer membrane lipoprotein
VKQEVAMKRILLFFVASLFLLAGGCAHVLSRQALLEVDPTLSFAQVKENPDAYKGKTLVLGGLIVDTRVDRQGTTLEVLHYKLDRWGEPQSADEAGGRFLARTDRFLDPELYKPGLFITLTGTVEGVETRPLQGYGYVYPVFRIREKYLWSRSYTVYPYGFYDPFYPWWPYSPYPYYYNDPFWYEPFPPYRYRPWPRGW